MICYIVNTAEYCHQTSGELAENVAKMINPHFADKVDISEVQVTDHFPLFLFLFFLFYPPNVTVLAVDIQLLCLVFELLLTF
jgi:hypothetical protein